jgi:hypothetical protein
MAPIFLDTTADFDSSPAAMSNTTTATSTTQRTLLLAPPSLAAREDRLSALFSVYSRAATDLQMLDRLAAGLVTLPAATYDLVLVLTDPDGSRRAEAGALLADRAVWARLVPAIKPGGKLRSEDGSLGGGGPSAGGVEAREAVLAGLVAVPGGDGFTKPEYAEEEVVPLRFGRGKKTNGEVNGAARSSAGPAVDAVTVNVGGKTETLGMAPPAAAAAAKATAGVGFVDFSDDLDLDVDDDDDDALIDEDTLLTEEDLRRPIQQPPECQPQPGKKRRACKDW